MVERAWSSADIRRFIGTFRATYLAHSHASEVRRGAASGGATTQILLAMLESGHIDGALVWTLGTREGQPAAVPHIATDPKAILAARTSKYVATYFARDAMPLVRQFEGRLAVVALPCDVSYLRRCMLRDADLERRVVAILGLFCGHNSRPELTEVVCARHGQDWEDLKDFSYRTGTWRGTLTMTPRTGSPLQVPTQQFTHFQNLHLFSERKCLSCYDHFAYEADISLGDSWSSTVRSREAKPTVIVVRTERGASAFSLAQPHLAFEAVPVEHVLSGNSRGLLYHYNVSARSQAARSRGERINDRLHLPTTWLDRRIAAMGTTQALWTLRHPQQAKRILERLPFPVLQLWIYAFKGLQELASHRYREFPDNRQISLIGATLTGNQGAAAMLETTIGELKARLPEAHFVVHSYFPDADREALGHHDELRVVDATPRVLVMSALPALLESLAQRLGLRLPSLLMPESLRELRSSTLLIDISGIALADGREKFLPFNLLCTWPASLVGTRVVKLAQALGPIQSLPTRLVTRFVMRHIAATFARGRQSHQHIQPWVGDGHVELSADLAFLYREEHALLEAWSHAIDPLIETLSTSEETVIAISVSSVVAGLAAKQDIDYLATLAEVIRVLVQEGHRVVLFPNACRDNTPSTRNNDLPIVEAIAQAVGHHPHLHSVSSPVNTAALRRMLSHANALLASRFHAMIAGLSLGVPTLVVGWSHKYQEMLELFGVDAHFVAFHDMTSEAILRGAHQLLDQESKLRARIESRLEEVQALARRQLEWLETFLAPPLHPDVEEP